MRMGTKRFQSVKMAAVIDVAANVLWLRLTIGAKIIQGTQANWCLDGCVPASQMGPYSVDGALLLGQQPKGCWFLIPEPTR